MSVWDRLKFSGMTTGVWEAGTRLGAKPPQISKGHQQKNWNFSKHHERTFGRGFYAAINRMPESEYKIIILRLVKRKERSRGRGEGLTEKQWRYLGLLMTKADPACLENPEIRILSEKKVEVKKETSAVIIRKKLRV